MIENSYKLSDIGAKDRAPAFSEKAKLTTTAKPREKIPVGVDVTTFADLSTLQRDFLSRAGLSGAAPTEAWTVTGSNQQMGYATHGVFRYFGKFPPPIASELITRYTSPGDLVVDPMCGSGTTGVEAGILNRRCVLSDVNPFSVLLSRVKTTWLPGDDTVAAIERTVSAASASKPSNFRPDGLRSLDHWFLPETIDSLARLRDAILLEPSDTVRDFLLIAFASTVRKVSKATTQQGRLFLDVETALADAIPVFERVARKFSIAIAAVKPEIQVVVMEREIKEPFPDLQLSAALSIIHPPYFNMYKYSAVNSLEMAWLGMDVKTVRKREVREFFKVGKPANVTRYLEDMAEGMHEACNQVAKGGIAAVMIGDTTIGGEHIRVTRPFLENLPTTMKLEKIALRVPKFTEATWAASQRRKGVALGVRLYDLIVVLRKSE